MAKKKEVLSAWTFAKGLQILTYKSEEGVEGVIKGPDGFEMPVPKDKAEMAAKGYTIAKSDGELNKFLMEAEKEFEAFQARRKK